MAKKLSMAEQVRKKMDLDKSQWSYIAGCGCSACAMYRKLKAKRAKGSK